MPISSVFLSSVYCSALEWFPYGTKPLGSVIFLSPLIRMLNKIGPRTLPWMQPEFQALLISTASNEYDATIALATKFISIFKGKQRHLFLGHTIGNYLASTSKNQEMDPDPTRAYFWPAVNKKLTCFWLEYFLTQPEKIFLTQREKNWKNCNF